jgi:hypothetical protein
MKRRSTYHLLLKKELRRPREGVRAHAPGGPKAREEVRPAQDQD